MTDQTFPMGTPTAFQIGAVEKKKDLPPSNGKPAKVILRVGLIAPNNAKSWAEMFEATDESSWPKVGESHTLIVKPNDNPSYAPSAFRPKKGGPAGGPRRDPVEEAARQAMIVHQHSQSAAIAELELAQDRPTSLAEIRKHVDARSEVFTQAALEVGERARVETRGRG